MKTKSNNPLRDHDLFLLEVMEAENAERVNKRRVARRHLKNALRLLKQSIGLGLVSLCFTAGSQDLPPLPDFTPAPQPSGKTFKSAATVKGATLQMQTAAASLVVSPPPKMFTIQWCDQNADVHTWEVWHSNTVKDFTLLATVGTNSYSKVVDRQTEFFKVRGVRVNADGTTTKSGWANNAPCP